MPNRRSSGSNRRKEKEDRRRHDQLDATLRETSGSVTTSVWGRYNQARDRSTDRLRERSRERKEIPIKRREDFSRSPQRKRSRRDDSPRDPRSHIHASSPPAGFSIDRYVPDDGARQDRADRERRRESDGIDLKIHSILEGRNPGPSDTTLGQTARAPSPGPCRTSYTPPNHSTTNRNPGPSNMGIQRTTMDRSPGRSDPTLDQTDELRRKTQMLLQDHKYSPVPTFGEIEFADTSLVKSTPLPLAVKVHVMHFMVDRNIMSTQGWKSNDKMWQLLCQRLHMSELDEDFIVDHHVKKFLQSQEKRQPSKEAIEVLVSGFADLSRLKVQEFMTLCNTRWQSWMGMPISSVVKKSSNEDRHFQQFAKKVINETAGKVMNPDMIYKPRISLGIVKTSSLYGVQMWEKYIDAWRRDIPTAYLLIQHQDGSAAYVNLDEIVEKSSENAKMATTIEASSAPVFQVVPQAIHDATTITSAQQTESTERVGQLGLDVKRWGTPAQLSQLPQKPPAPEVSPVLDPRRILTLPTQQQDLGMQSKDVPVKSEKENEDAAVASNMSLGSLEPTDSINNARAIMRRGFDEIKKEIRDLKEAMTLTADVPRRLELEEVRIDATKTVKKEYEADIYVLAQFFHVAFSKVQSASVNNREKEAFAGVIASLASGPDMASRTMKSIMTGSETKVTSTKGEELEFTFAELKRVATVDSRIKSAFG